MKSIVVRLYLLAALSITSLLVIGAGVVMLPSSTMEHHARWKLARKQHVALVRLQESVNERARGDAKDNVRYEASLAALAKVTGTKESAQPNAEDNLLQVLERSPAWRQPQIITAWIERESAEEEREELETDLTVSRLSDIGTIVVAVFLAIVLGAMTMILPRLRRELRALQAGAAAITRGELGRRFAITGKDELADLARAFDGMSLSLQRNAQMAVERAQTAKLAAIGTLTSGIAHEVNNPLGVILGFAQGMERRVAENDPLRLPVMSIAREAMRCKRLVQELLTFARTGQSVTELIDLRDVISSASVLLGPKAKATQIAIEVTVADEPLVVRASPTQLEQVILNLGANGMDAAQAGSVLRIAARRTGAQVVVEVTDHGSGMAAEIKERVLEPFFTTKPPGKGTGLGLSISYEIVRHHGGELAIESDLGRGTTVSFRLPHEDARKEEAA